LRPFDGCVVIAHLMIAVSIITKHLSPKTNETQHRMSGMREFSRSSVFSNVRSLASGGHLKQLIITKYLDLESAALASA
jgi:hypothetical protein